MKVKVRGQPPVAVRREGGSMQLLVAAHVCVLHLMDEVPDVSWVRHDRSDGILRLGDDGTLVHPADTGRLAVDVLQGVGLLQLAQVVVLRGDTEAAVSRHDTEGVLRRRIPQDLTWSSSPPPSSSYLRMLSLTSSSGSISSCFVCRSFSLRLIHTTNNSTMPAAIHIDTHTGL